MVFLERGDNMTRKMNDATKAALIRLARTAIPQIPAVCAYLVGLKPEWAIALAFLGTVGTALDKFLRDLKVY